MWIILGLFFFLPTYALESFDSLQNVKLLRVLKDNIIVLDRGLEDGIVKNDHAKISNEVAGYSSRALCLKSSTNLSYWKIYRVPHAEAYSKDFTYTLTGYSDREMPLRMLKLLQKNPKIIEEDKKVEGENGSDPFQISRDLPEKLTERDLLETITPEKRKLFVEQVINKDQLRKDLSDYQLSFYASPFSKQSINEGENFRYGVRGGNIASKYRLMTQFEQQSTRLTDPETRKSVSARSTIGQIQFVIHQLSYNFSSLSLINFNSQYFGKLGTPKSNWQIGPIGFTWHFHAAKSWEYMDLSYIPLYDIRKTDVINNGEKSENRISGIRHGFRFGLKNKLNEKVAFENTLWIKPFQDPSTWKIETDNLNLSNDLKLIFNITEKLFFDYNLIFQKDKLWKTVSGISETNTINSVNFRYDLNL